MHAAAVKRHSLSPVFSIIFGATCLLISSGNAAAGPRAARVSLVYCDRYLISIMGLERLHSFDIQKYQHIYKQLLADRLIKPELVAKPKEIADTDILRVQTRVFLANLNKPANIAEYLEAPAAQVVPLRLLKSGVLKPFRLATGGTLLAARRSLKNGIGINLAGGYHHAMPNRGEGFCIYADMPIAIRALQAEGKIRRALIIDLDAHQGNGTAECLANDSTTFTFSIHQQDIYPIPKAKSDLDIGIQFGTTDDQYLKLLTDALPKVFKAAETIDIVVYQAGCDVLADDPLTTLAMTHNGIVKRDRMVVDECVRRGIPIVMTLGGGYSKDAWKAQYASIASILKKYGQAPEN